MNPTCVIIVTGPPCSGKTTLARRLAQGMGIALITKDDIKEILFEHLGWKDRLWSKQLGDASIALLYQFAEVMLQSNTSVILESNFHPEQASPKFMEFLNKYSLDFVEIQCTARRDVLIDRLKERAEKRMRHPGHNDAQYLQEFENLPLDIASYRLYLNSSPIIVETTGSQDVDVGALIINIQQILMTGKIKN